MIDFKPLDPAQKAAFEAYLRAGSERGCEFSFANLYMWGSQRAAVIGDRLVLFARWGGKYAYPFPVGPGDLKTAVDAVLEDARERGIPCRLTGLVGEERDQLEALYPGQFRYRWCRDSFDYVYDIHALADLRGKKLQKKRNHLHRFRDAHPDYAVEILCRENTDRARAFLEEWFTRREEEDSYADFYLERKALDRGLANREALGMEGMLLTDGGRILAFTMGSALSDTTFDVHFEKADPAAEGAYAAINCEFARYLRDKYPGLQFLNREEDMGLEGLRRAKLSYKPHHMVEKIRACLEDCDCED